MGSSLSSEELSRLDTLSLFEKSLRLKGYKQIAGVDEAGRGPLAGPVVAAACVLPETLSFKNLNDSKLLTAAQRDRLFEEITTTAGVHYGIGIADVETIDRVNILQATFLAMREAVKKLPVAPDYLLIDGSQIPHFDSIPTEALVKGDSRSVSIAAASILAKVTRDRILVEIDRKWPQYGFKQHKGYGTEQHVQAIHKWGPSPMHRKSFEPVKSILSPPPTQIDVFNAFT